jgi:hypothetical protein
MSADGARMAYALGVKGTLQAAARLAAVVILLATSTSGPSFARGEDREEMKRREFQNRRLGALIEAGTRFVEVGVWCRDAGLVKQASAEFLRAVEVSDGKNHWANKVVALMRSLDEKFWKSKNEKPSKGMLAGHEKRAKAALDAARKDRFSLAKWAEKQGLEDEATGEYVGYLADLGEPLEVDAEGRIVVDGTTIPLPASKRILAKAVTINDRLHVRDEFLEIIPEVSTVHQASSPALRVRTERDRAQADELLAIATGAMPLLEDEVGGRPTRRMDVYVFQDRKVYESYLRKTKMASHTAATGIADAARNLVLVCAQGLDDAAVRGMVLHELTHLFQYGVTRAVMPSWYTEGLAESFGAPSAFTWEKGVYRRAGAATPPSAWGEVKTAQGYLPLDRLLSASAIDLIATEPATARRFYVESWAFYAYMTTAAPKDVREQFALWETICGGKALGAEAGNAGSRNSAPAAELFRSRMASKLAEIESGFREWLGVP